MAIIEVENLKYRYPHTEKLALSGISFSVEKGELIGIAGENGAGKSTLCQALIGLVPQFFKGAYGGLVRIGGEEAAGTPVSSLCRKVGLIFQNPFNQLSGAKDTVFEEIAFGLQNMGVPAAEMAGRVEEALERMDIAPYRDRNPFDLSGGQMQRVAIASILAMRPEIIVLDEPTSQLDPQGSEEVFRAVEQLARSGITIVMVEQKQEKLAAYCDRILLLRGGRQIDFDTPEKIFLRPDLLELGVQAPVFSRICRALDVKDKDGCYPVTEEAAAGALKSKITWDEPQIINKPETRIESEARAFAEYETETKRGKWNVSGEEKHPGTDMQCQPESEEPVFRIQDLDFSYFTGTPVLKGLNLDLDSRATAVIGQNGAGKTTLVKLLKGLLKPVGGSVYYGGRDIAGQTVAMLASEIGYVFQNPDDQIFKYNVLDEVMFGPLNIGMDREKARQLSMDALRLVGLEGQIEENPYDLELAQRKMVAVASVLAMDTQVIILDEPTIAQDYRGKTCIGGIIRSKRAEGRAVLAILHDMDFVAEYFERIIIMAHGRVLADGTASEAFSDEKAVREARVELTHTAALAKKLGMSRLCLTPEEFLESVGHMKQR